MANRKRVWVCTLFLFIIPSHFKCYEKTLRKIVRNQSKMVQQPFSVSDSDHESIIWKNMSYSYGNDIFHLHGNTITKHKNHRPKMSTFITSVDSGRSKSTFSKSKVPRSESINPFEARMARNTPYKNAGQTTTDNSILLLLNKNRNNTDDAKKVSDFDFRFKPIIQSSFFPSVNERDQQSSEQKVNKDNTIVIPSIAKDDNNIIHQSIFIRDSNINTKVPPGQLIKDMKRNDALSIDVDDEKADFVIEVTPDINNKYSYNVTSSYFVCSSLTRIKSDIDALKKFSTLDIEPSWMSKKHYWDHIFDSRYESLMRSRSWPSLRVILIPSTHVDSIWKHTFEQYHNQRVNKILSNIVKKLQFYSNFTFSWNEVSHLSQWWRKTTQRKRALFKKLLKSGRLEITTGAWVETEEATAHIFGMVHQLIEGHQWLKQNLNYLPKVGWSTNSVTHSPTYPYLLSASGISKLVLTNLHFSWEQYLAEFQYSDFIWLQDWDHNIYLPTNLNQALNRIGDDKYPKSAVHTHFLQFNSDNFQGCGPNKKVCSRNFDFQNTNKNIAVHSYNIKQKAEMLLEQYSKTGTITPHNVLIAPLGGRFRYESQMEFDFQYNNYQRLAEFINLNKDIYKANVEFGTPGDYFDLIPKNKAFLTVKGDFLNYADIKSGVPAYWTGFFTSRPLLKIWLRRLHSTLRSTEILMAFAVNFNVIPHYNSSNLFELLVKSRETVARLQDRHVVGGTLSYSILQYVYKTILATAKDCWTIQEIAASLLTAKPDNTNVNLKKFVYREGEFISNFKTVSPGDQIYVFNSLSQERTEIIELTTKQPNIRVINHKNKDLSVQINPIWIYNSDNMIKISNKFFKIIFAVIVPPLTLEMYRVKETYETAQTIATIYCTNCILDTVDGLSAAYPFNILPIQPGDVQLESYKHRIIVDEKTGFLKTVVEKERNIEKPFIIDYGAFRSFDTNAGIFLFNTNVSKPLHDILISFRLGMKSKVSIIVAGQVTTEMTSIYGKLLQHTVKLFNLLASPLANSIYVESKVDYELSPKYRELEIFLTIKTDISNGNNPEIYVDNNGFQYTPRVINISRRIESNIFPMTSMVFIQDKTSRVTLITDHAQAVTALQEGNLVVMLDRRVLFDDGRGVSEGLADSSATYHRHYLLLENFVYNEYQGHHTGKEELSLPSFSALRLSNSLDYMLDIFLANQKHAHLSHFTFLPLIKTSFPCDIDLINFRVILNRAVLQQLASNTALLVLHRRGIMCRIYENPLQHCNSESNFMIEKVFRNTKAAFLTNLVGTDDGSPTSTITSELFPAMEIVTFKLFF